MLLHTYVVFRLNQGIMIDLTKVYTLTTVMTHMNVIFVITGNVFSVKF